MKWFIFAEGKAKFKGSESKIAAFLTSIIADLAEDFSADNVLQILAEKFVHYFPDLLHEILKSVNSVKSFQTVFASLVCFLTHSQLLTGRCEQFSNTLYAIVKIELIQLTDLFCVWMDTFLNSTPISFEHLNPNPGEILYACSLTQIVLPFLELLRIFLIRFKEPKFLDSLGKQIESIGNLLKKWQKLQTEGKIYQLQALNDAETSYCVNAALKTYLELCKITGMAYLNSTKNLNLPLKPSKNFKLVGSDVRAPNGTNHDNDHFNISQIQIVPTFAELFSKNQNTLPGNHQFEEGCHWLPPGPERLYDTHFRLLREDMVRSFSSCVQAAFELIKVADANSSLPNFSTLYREAFICSNVNVLGREVKKDSGIIFNFSFDHYQVSDSYLEKRMQFGSLVCLVWKVGGHYSTYFGTVADREKILKRNIWVK
jgi:hypothetical protein